MSLAFPNVRRFSRCSILLLFVGSVFLEGLFAGCPRKAPREPEPSSVTAPAAGPSEEKVARAIPESSKTSVKKVSAEEKDPPGFLCERTSPDEKTCRRITPDLF